MKLKNTLFLCSTILFSASLFAYSGGEVTFKSYDASLNGAKDHQLLKRFPGAVIFDYIDNKAKDYSLMLGSIHYEESEDFDESGYRATQTENVNGSLTRIVYDYPESVSLTSIVSNVKRSLAASGFEKRFFCEKESCGSASGWKTFLYKYLGENDKAQQYYVADKENTTVAFYVVDIAGQARGVLDIVKSSGRKPVQNLSNNFKIYFELGKSEVDPLQIDKVAGMINVAFEKKSTLLIQGYADSSGSQDYNQTLSNQRAMAVKKLINKKFSFPENKIEAVGKGAIYNDDVVANATNNALNRRVEIILITTS